MEIVWTANTLHSVYRVPCNIEGEPEYAFQFKAGYPVQLSYEVRERGQVKTLGWRSLQ